jgi:hypothetical protein
LCPARFGADGFIRKGTATLTILKYFVVFVLAPIAAVVAWRWVAMLVEAWRGPERWKNGP